MKIIETRLAYLDATRAFALMLGVVFHASLSFLPVFIGWAVQDISTSPVIATVITVSHSFRMELFFLLAGFFSHMTLQRKGLMDLLKSRAVRIIGPFIAGWFILRPLIVSGWIMGGASMRGDYEFWPSIMGGIQELKDIPEGPLVGTHLWFLYYLVLLTACTLVARFLINLLAGGSNTLGPKIDQTVAWMSRSFWALPLVVTAIAVTLSFMQNWGVDTPDKSLVPHVPVLILYGGFFGLGWLLDRQPDALTAFSRITLGRGIFAILGIVGVLMLMPIQSDPGHPQFEFAHRFYNVGYAAMMWTLVWFTIGVFRRCFAQPNTAVRYVADSSYWMYLIHLPIVIWLQVAMAEVELPWSVKLGIISIATIGIALLTYDLFVRSTAIGQILNGRRRPRAIFARHVKSN